jgi:adenylate cyclase
METGNYYLIDMGSRNGSFIDDRRVSTPAPLKDGDRISLGGFPIAFQQEGGARPAIPAPADADAGSTHVWFLPQLMTVLVVDVRDFTRLAQQIDQNVLFQAIGTWFRSAGDVLRAHGCWTLKYIGDAVMAVWLHREPRREALGVFEVLSAVSEFVQATSDLDKEFPLPFPWRFGAGVNTGIASIGNTGTGSVIDYTALGDPVNAAFRIETITKQIGVDMALGDATFELLGQNSEPGPYFEERTVQLKGYDKPQRVWATSFQSLREFVEATLRRHSDPGKRYLTGDAAL